MTSDWTTTPPPAGSGVGAEPTALVALRTLLDASDAATLVFALDGTVIDSNPAGRALFRGPDPGHPGGRLPMRDVVDQVPQRLFTDPNGGEWRGELSQPAADGPTASYAVTVVVRHAPDLPAGGFVGVVARDITAQVNQATALGHQIDYDTATGLLTRRALVSRLADTLAAGRDIAVLMIDVDGLGEINSALGYQVGDQVLVAMAQRLAGAVRPIDPVARVGGDEFAVLCHDISGPHAATELADRVRRVLTGHVGVPEAELNVSVSVGVALADRLPDGTGPAKAAATLLDHADAGLHLAKRSGRSGSALYSAEIGTAARQRASLATELQRALRNREFRLEYQPILSAVTERVEAAEALLRWDHPARGPLEAHEFVRLAEQTGVLSPIGDWVLDTALGAARSWIDAGAIDDRFGIHVNVSRAQLAGPKFVNRVVELLDQHRLQPRQLVVEAREATLLASGGTPEVEAAIRTVRALRRLGVRVAIDNFGTGASALSVLTDVGADVLKLDGSLALPTGASEADTRVVRALVMLAHALDMEVVAERVAGVDQLRRLRAAGCDLVQGHLVGMPAPPEAFA